MREHFSEYDCVHVSVHCVSVYESVLCENVLCVCEARAFEYIRIRVLEFVS